MKTKKAVSVFDERGADFCRAQEELRRTQAALTKATIRMLAVDSSIDWPAHAKRLEQSKAVNTEKKKRVADGQAKGTKQQKEQAAKNHHELKQLIRASIARGESFPAKSYVQTDRSLSTIYRIIEQVKKEPIK